MSVGFGAMKGCAGSKTSLALVSSGGPGGCSIARRWSVGIIARISSGESPASEPYVGKAMAT